MTFFPKPEGLVGIPFHRKKKHHCDFGWGRNHVPLDFYDPFSRKKHKKSPQSNQIQVSNVQNPHDINELVVGL